MVSVLHPYPEIAHGLLQPIPGPYYHADDFARDQIEDYAARKSMTVAEVERWLASRLAYEPEEAESKDLQVAA